MEAARKQQQEIVGLWPIPDMAEQMRVEHERLAQLGWVYDGFGGYRKKAASSLVAGCGVLKQVELSARDWRSAIDASARPAPRFR
jgi:hypothetical protein